MFLLRVYMSWIGLGLVVFQFNQLPQAMKSLPLTHNSFKNQLNPKCRDWVELGGLVKAILCGYIDQFNQKIYIFFKE